MGAFSSIQTAHHMIEVKPLARSWQFWRPVGKRLRPKSARLNETSLLVAPRSTVTRWHGTAFQSLCPRFGAPIYSRARIEKLATDQGVAGKVGPYSVMLRLVVNALFSLLLAILLLGSGARAQNDATESLKAPVPVYIFFSTSCPHCARALGFLTAALRA